MNDNTIKKYFGHVSVENETTPMVLVFMQSGREKGPCTKIDPTLLV